MEALGLFGALTLLSIEDIKEHAISIVWVIIFGIIGMLFHVINGRLSIWNILGGMSIGAVVYVISIISHEVIGKGDALLIGMTGIFLGFWGNIVLIWTGSLFAAAAGIAAVAVFKKSKSYRIPFVPFVLLGYLCCIILWGGRLIE